MKLPARRARSRVWLGRLVPVLLVAGAAAGVCLIAAMPRARAPEVETEIPPVNVTVETIRAIPELADTFDLTAVVEANRVVRVAAEVSARIERIGQRKQELVWRGRVYPEGVTLAEGEPVSEGQPIIHLNRGLLSARYERAKAQFEYDLSEHRRILDLFEQNAASKTELDNARTRKDVSKAALDEATEELDRSVVVAPIRGVLNRLPMEVGEYATPGDCVAEIVDLDVVKVVVDVPERDVFYLSAGDTAEVFTQSVHESKLTGRITYISELADEGTRTTPLEITLDNREQVLRSGQIIRARLTRRVLADVIMIPLSAVVPLETGKAVYVVGPEDRAERRDVELGLLKGRRVRIVDGLAVGDRLIVAGHRYVGPGQAVAVVEEQ